jgi:hypothetical protein
MSTRYATVIIVAEDERSANLLRRYVERALGVTNRRVRQLISPSAQGDAKQWVIARYPIEIRAVRRGLANLGLVIHLDADVDSVQDRLNELATALASDGQDPRAPDERVSFAIPRRHTETWLAVLTGIQVNENLDCKRSRIPPDPEKRVKAAAEQLYSLTRLNAQPAPLPSLVAAITELRRL